MGFFRKDSWDDITVLSSSAILDAAQRLQDTGDRIAIVLDEVNHEFMGIITDADIRRGMLRGYSSEQACSLITNTSPQTVTPEVPFSEVRAVMEAKSLTALPILDDNRQIRGVWTSHIGNEERKNLVVIMAGGKGTRLRPMTINTPKPLVSVGDKPMLHHLLQSLANSGFHNITISINYLGEQIQKSVGDGSSWGLSVVYLEEPAPLGTAGALGLLSKVPADPILVLNADVVTRANLGELISNHELVSADLSVGMRLHDIEHPFGVLDIEGSRIVGIREKPVWREFVSAGVYVMSPTILGLIEMNRHLDMPELITKAIAKGLSVEGFPLHESWLDVGTPSDYARAQHMVGD
jgi:dTDP-glucose pyrophosphorylase/predicted transcriptional regulator